MIPWDGRVFKGANNRYTRQRTGYNEENKEDLYVLSNGIYLTIEDY
jgi:hypothetical protein